MNSRSSFLRMFNCLCSVLLVFAACAVHATPTAPSNFSMPMYTYYSGNMQMWKVQWTDTSTDEDGFQIYWRWGGWNGGGPVLLYQTIPTATTLSAVTTTNGSMTVTCDSTAFLSVGWIVSSTSIPAGTTVASITNSTTFVLSTAATVSGSGQTLSAASALKAASGYTYTLNMPVAAAAFAGYGMEWWVASYQGTPPTSIANYSNEAFFQRWPGTLGQPATPSAPSGLAVSAPGNGLLHIAFTNTSSSTAYFELGYKLHTDTAWKSVALDFGSTAADVGGSPSASGSTYVYLPNFQIGAAYDFQVRAFDYNHNTSAFSNMVTGTAPAP